VTQQRPKLPMRARPAATWTLFVQGGTWACTVLLAFVVSPPGIAFGSKGFPWSDVARFLVTMLNGLALVAAARLRAPRQALGWAVVAGAALILGFGLLALYSYLVEAWTCAVFGERLVIGIEVTQVAARYNARGTKGCAELLADFASDPLRIWRPDEVIQRATILGWCFIGVVGLLGLAVIALVQAYGLMRRRGERDTFP
jgi:hypothetical protein